jgi:hypothetical protein
VPVFQIFLVSSPIRLLPSSTTAEKKILHHILPPPRGSPWTRKQGATGLDFTSMSRFPRIVKKSLLFLPITMIIARLILIPCGNECVLLMWGIMMLVTVVVYKKSDGTRERSLIRSRNWLTRASSSSTNLMPNR